MFPRDTPIRERRLVALLDEFDDGVAYYPPGFVERGRGLGLVQLVGVEIPVLKVDPVDETIEEGWLLRTGRIGRLTIWIAGN